MKEIIQTYLEEQSKLDPALKQSFYPDKMDKCIEYITSQAKKELKGKNGAIEDSKVFHWAREFFVDGICSEQCKNSLAIAKKSVTKSDKQKKLEALRKLQGEFNF